MNVKTDDPFSRGSIIQHGKLGSGMNLESNDLKQLGYDASESQIQQLKDYLSLLQRWNKVYNLTAIRDMDAMLPLHIFDSLSVLPFIDAHHCLDVGSGAGLPGIPLAIMQPDTQFTLLDSNGKKTRFIQQSVIQLSLSNVNVVHGRIEDLGNTSSSQEGFDVIISRAFASITDFVSVTGQYLSKNGKLLAMKGRFPASELEQMPSGYQVLTTHQLDVPGVDGERHLIEIQKHEMESVDG